MCKGNKSKLKPSSTKNASDCDPHDDRPLVKDLLQEHKTKIEDIRQKIRSDEVCKPLFDKNFERYDDLWILRFVLTHKGKVKDATKAVLKTIKFREEQNLNELGDIRHLIKNYGIKIDDNENANAEEFPPFYHEYNAVCGKDCITVTQPDPDRGIMVYMDVGNFDVAQLIDTLTQDQQKEYRIRSNEATFQVLDEVTRRTGRLTKVFNLIDHTDSTLSKLNRKALNQDAAITKELEDYWPQMLASIYIFNAPSWLNGLWKVIKHVFPKRIVDKVDFMPTSAVSGKFYKPILKFVTEENLPEKYGGKNKNWPLPSISEQLAAAKASS